MKDKLLMARCNESEVNTFIQTLNDYTLLLTKDTHNLYTKLNGTRLHLATGSTLFALDQPIHKELSMYATNDDNLPIVKDRYYGVCGNEDGTYRLCDSLQYDGELVGILDSTDVVDGNKYVITLIQNKNVFTDVQGEMVKWKPVYVGNYRGTVLAVVNPAKLDVVFGIAGVVTDITSNPLIGKFTFNSFLLQSTYFSRIHSDDEHIKELIRVMLLNYYDKSYINSALNGVDARLDLVEAFNSNVYNKNEINVKLHDKLDVVDSYNRVEIDGKLLRKADKFDVYNKSEAEWFFKLNFIK